MYANRQEIYRFAYCGDSAYFCRGVFSRLALDLFSVRFLSLSNFFGQGTAKLLS